MLSGIGPADALRTHSLEVVADLPGVGANLSDHPMGWSATRPRSPCRKGSTLRRCRRVAHRPGAVRAGHPGRVLSPSPGVALLTALERVRYSACGERIWTGRTADPGPPARAPVHHSGCPDPRMPWCGYISTWLTSVMRWLRTSRSGGRRAPATTAMASGDGDRRLCAHNDDQPSMRITQLARPPL
jgi:hypothetical protein